MISLFLGDCLDRLQELPDNSVDSIVTDPPYGLSFMGKDWDHGIPGKHFWEEALRVAKPGAHILAFGGTRTYHRLACALEDAGWEIRDCVMWVYGQGFPKSLDISKAIDKQAGAERVVIGQRQDILLKQGADIKRGRRKIAESLNKGAPERNNGFITINADITAPATDSAKQWEGWGTALKPAYEPIILARKPLSESTVAGNVLKYGTGGINIDGCRIELEKDSRLLKGGSYSGNRTGSNKESLFNAGNGVIEYETPPARFPSNFIHDGSEEVLELFPDAKSGKGNGNASVHVPNEKGVTPLRRGILIARHDSGSAARFFYCAKASKSDRNEGCEGVLTWESVDLEENLNGVALLLKDISEDTMFLLGDKECFTMLFGKNTMAQSPKDLMFTIKMVIELIIELKTLNCSQNLNIKENILDAIRMIQGNGLNLAESVAFINQSQIIMNEKAESALGVIHAVLKMLLQIKEKGKQGNIHNTVKPTSLMQYLCRLITPKGGTILDPFMGSGSTGKAAMYEGFDFVGIEKEEEYFKIAEKRIIAAQRGAK